jgi:hypothetical protein
MPVLAFLVYHPGGSAYANREFHADVGQSCESLALCTPNLARAARTPFKLLKMQSM